MSSKLKEENNYIMLENKNKIRKLEKFYVDGQLDNLPTLVEKKKNDLISKIDEFQNKYVQINVDKFGNETTIFTYIGHADFRKNNNKIEVKEEYKDLIEKVFAKYK